MSDIILRNVQIDGTLFSPGIVRCNATAPCTGFVFDNVQVTNFDQWPFGESGYKVENVYGSVTNCLPTPVFTGPALLDDTPATDDEQWLDESQDDAAAAEQMNSVDF